MSPAVAGPVGWAGGGGTSKTIDAILPGFMIGVTKWMRRYIEANPPNWLLDHENPQGRCYGQGEKLQFFCY